MDDATRAAFADLRKLMTDQHERLLNQMNSLDRNFLNTKSFLIDDALTLGRRIAGIEDRLDGLENHQGWSSTRSPISSRPSTISALK